MSLKIDKYPDSVQALQAQLERARKAWPRTRLTALADILVAGAQGFDRARAGELGLNHKYVGLVRDAARPPEFEHADLAAAPWADNPATPLQPGEQWNRGRRATLTRAVYEFDRKGRPQNPYMNTGLQGRGVLGQFGPNHAVDNGIVVVKDDRLYFVGITRKHDNDAPALSGGFAKFSANYEFDREAEIQTRVEEFFEEMVSGSVALLPDYAARVPADLPADEEARDQVITALKLEQVRDLDPGFLQRLEAHIRKGVECFAGPVLCDGRNTNTAWIESRLSWALFDDDIWAAIKGDDKFGYRLAGGDDASSVVWHEFGAGIVRTAYASHGPMMAFMGASFLLHAQETGMTLAPGIIAQLEDAAGFLQQFSAPPPRQKPRGPGNPAPG